MQTPVCRERAIVGLVCMVIVVALAGVPGVARAQGWLAGANVGLSHTADYSIGDGGETTSLSDSDVGLAVFGGYTLSKFLGGVGGYLDLGETKASGPSWGGFTDVIKVRGFYLGWLGTQPLNQRVGFFATGGMFIWQQRVDYADSYDEGTYNEWGIGPALGVGANIDLTPGHAIGLQIEWMTFLRVGDPNNSGHRYTRHLIAAGINFRSPH